jgi:hypothetical protein
MLFNIIVSFIHCYEFDAIGNKRSSPDFDDADFDNDPLGKKVINICFIQFFSIRFCQKPNPQIAMLLHLLGQNES